LIAGGGLKKSAGCVKETGPWGGKKKVGGERNGDTTKKRGGTKIYGPNGMGMENYQGPTL